MSGPKISVYALTGRARTIVMGQIHCEQQSIICAEKIQTILRSLQRFFENFDQQIKNIQLLIKRTSEGEEQIQKLQALRETVEKEAAEIQQELAAHMPHVSVKYMISEEAYTEKQAELRRLQALKKRAEHLEQELTSAFEKDRQNTAKIQASIMNVLDDLGGDIPDDLALSDLKQEDERTIQRIQTSIIDDLSGVYSFEMEEETSDAEFQSKKDALQKSLDELLSDEKLPHLILVEIRQAMVSLERIDSLPYLNTFHSVTIMALAKKIEAYHSEREKMEAEFGELVSRYEALCSMAGQSVQTYLCSETSIEALHGEIERMESALIKQQEQSYIHECVDDVMAEMGYDLIGTRQVHKKSGKQFKNELYTFHDGTAVNITFASDGQISMELGGLAREDRTPTMEEAELLTQDMETFCGEFAEFEQRLRSKGVVIQNRIALSPPTADYAAVINVNDYDITAEAQISEMNVTEKRHKAAEKKVLRREN